MKIKIKITIAAILLFGAIVLNSCHKKRGMVPCPSYSQIEMGINNSNSEIVKPA